MHPAARRPCRTRNCGSRARLLLLLLLLLPPLACSFCCCCCCCTHPPWRTPTSRGHIRAHGGSNPVVPSFGASPCARNFGKRDIATPWSGADDLQLSERITSSRCSEARQAWAASKGSRTTRTARLRNVRQRAPIRPRGGGRHKGACEGGERDWDGFFCSSPVSPGPWATPRRSAASSATKTRRLSATDSRRRPRFAPGSSGKEE